MTYPKVALLIVANNSHRPAVVLIHGLHQNDWVMKPLSYKLQRLGFAPYLYHYRSLKDPLSVHSQRLHRFMSHAMLYRPHIIAHSLGGLVARQFLLDYPHFEMGRIVTLGTPHQGSTTAHYIKRLIPALIGQSYHNALDGHLPDTQHTPQIELGVIAGTKATGLGQPFLFYHHKKHPAINSPHDGTVFVSETQLSWAKDHITLPVSHTGMLMNGEVASQAAYFLQHGHFQK